MCVCSWCGVIHELVGNFGDRSSLLDTCEGLTRTLLLSMATSFSLALSMSSPQLNTHIHDIFEIPSAETDLVIRTSDNVRLYATKSILTCHSPFFAKHFVDDSQNVFHEFKAKQDCRDMRAILHLCSPTKGAATPYILEAAFWGSLLFALRKYEMMEWAKESLRDMVAASEWPRKEPLMTFVMARRCDWEDIGRTAAWESLRFPLRTGSIPELGLITGLDYHSFIEYFWRCADAARDFLKGMPVTGRTDCELLSLEVKRPFPESLLNDRSFSYPEEVACKCQEPQRIKCERCSEFSDALLFNKRTGEIRFMHPCLRPLIQRALSEVERCPRIGLFHESILQDTLARACPSQTPEMIQTIVSILDDELESVLRSVSGHQFPFKSDLCF